MDESTLQELEHRQLAGKAMGGEEAIAKHHAQGKLTARERVELLLDKDSFVEIGLHARSVIDSLKERTPADGFVAGSGKIDGRKVFVTAEDATVLAGTRGRIAEIKSSRVRELAAQNRKPLVCLAEAGAARVQEAYGAMAAGIGIRFGEHYRLSGRVPQVSAMMGACFGGPSFAAAQSDFVTVVENTGFMGMSGPPVVKVGIGIDVTKEEIGGSHKSARETGQAHHLGRTEQESLQAIRGFLSYLPSNCWEAPPRIAPQQAPIDTPAGRQAVSRLVPDNHRRAYDMRRLVTALSDGGEVFYIHEEYAPNVITAFGRIQGETVGFVANNPFHRAGVLDERCAHKVRQFVDLCDAFHVPLAFLIDCPGFLVGPEIENQRMVSLAARLLNTLVGITVPRTTIVLRKAIGLAYLALCGRAMGPDTLVAWPTARFDVMGPEAGVELVYGKEIARSPDPEARRAEVLEKIARESTAYLAAELGLVDDVIHPGDTRRVILDTIERCRTQAPLGFKHRLDP